jgi:cell division septation protein DedD/DNA-binding response OmpR family regulator
MSLSKYSGKDPHQGISQHQLFFQRRKIMDGKTILVIDNDKELMQKMISILESEDYLVFTALNKDDSLTLARKVNPSLIYINIGMSAASGLEIAKEIHEADTLRDVPIVILTPHGGSVDQRYTSLYGIVEFLQKSFEPEELLTKTKEILSGQSIRAEHAGETHEAPPATPVYIEESLTVEEQSEEEESDSPEAIESLFSESWDQSSDTIAPEEEIAEAEEETATKAEHTTEEKQDQEKETEEDSEVIFTHEDATGPDEPMVSEPPEEPDEGESVPRKDILRHPHHKEHLKTRKVSIPLIIILVVAVVGAGLFFLLRAPGDNLPEQTAGTAPSVAVQQEPLALSPDQELPKDEPAPGAQQPQHAVKEKPQVTPPPKPSAPEAPKKAEPAPAAKKAAKKKPASATTGTAATPAAASPSAKGYAIQVGAFQNEKNANILAKNLKDKGYDVRVSPDRNNSLHRVLVGTYPDREDAVRMLNSLRAKENMKGFIYKE